MTTARVPTFAVVGSVNKGKTSVVSTLIEDDDLRISRTPGETTRCQRLSVIIDGAEVLCFYDTPGFQNERSALAWLKAHSDLPPMERLRAFRRAHARDPAFEAECELLAPVLDGSGIIYIADASFPLRANHKAEMEILRLTAQPRMAVINNTGPNAAHLGEWKTELQQHFNLVREFNAHRASFASRIRLLEDLCRIEENWRRDLEASVRAFQQDWQSRMARCAEMIAELLFDCLTQFETENLASGNGLEAAKERLARKYHERIRAREKEAHNTLRKIFKHSRLKIGSSKEELLTEDLFSETTWQVFGLTQKQLVLAATAAGAASGTVVDALAFGHTLGIPTILGGAIGAGSAWLGGRQLAKVEVRLPGRLGRMIGRAPLGGIQLKVGPHQNLNFPWIVLDRALMICYQLANWTHARRDDFTVDPAALEREIKDHKILSANWPKERRRECEETFVAIRKQRTQPEDRARLRNAIEQALDALSEG
jgi:hypothetical protein